MKIKRSHWPLGIIALVFVAMLVNWVGAVARYQVNGLFSDQWSFYTPLFKDAGWWTLFTWQHGPHRQGIAFVLSSWVAGASGWDVRVESLWIVACLAAATGLTLGLKARVAGRIRLSDTWVVMAGLSLLQYETVLLVPNASHSVFPLLLLMLAAHLMVGNPSRGKLVGIGVMGVLALFTGFGLFVAVGLGGYLGWRAVTVAADRVGCGMGLAVMAVGGVIFLRGYGFSPASEGFQFPPESGWAAVRFAGLMLASRMGTESTSATASLVGLATGLLMVVAALGAWRQRKPNDGGGRDVGLVMLLVGVGFVGFSTLGRVHLGEVGALASRYTTLVVLLWWGLDILMTNVSRPILRRGVVVMGWIMAIGPLTGLIGRPVADWLGTAGLRKGDLVNLQAFEHRKLAWIAELRETDDWRTAERRVPNGVFPFVESLDLDARLAWMEVRGLSFHRQGEDNLGWLPWTWGGDVIWWRPRSGGETRSTAEGGRWFVAPQSGGYINIAFTPTDDQVVQIEWDEKRSGLESPGRTDGISIPATATAAVLKMDGIRRAKLPQWSSEPTFSTWSWTGEAWQQDHWLKIEAGFHGWEEDGAYGWGRAHVRARVGAVGTAFLNIVIDSRFEPVAQGEVTIRFGNAVAPVPWVGERAAFSIAITNLAAGSLLELINAGGEQSPAELGMWEDSRQLALRLSRLSVDAQADYPILNLR